MSHATCQNHDEGEEERPKKWRFDGNGRGPGQPRIGLEEKAADLLGIVRSLRRTEKVMPRTQSTLRL
jgi:hypothetical protein